MCENNINYGAVSVKRDVNPPGQTCQRYTGKPYYLCVMENPELGRGAYQSDYPEEVLELSNVQVSTFLKKSSPPLPSFDLIKCNVDGTRLTCRLPLAANFNKSPTLRFAIPY